MKVLRHISIGNGCRRTIYKIINKGLYMGEVARAYLREKKGKTEEETDLIIPPYCIYTGWAYSNGYNPRNPKALAQVCLTYDYAFWDSPLAQAVWSEAIPIIKIFDDQFQIFQWTDVIKALDFDLKTINLNITLKISTMILSLHVLYCFHKHLNDSFTDESITDTMIDYAIENIKTKFHYKITELILLTPGIHHKIHLRSRNAQGKQLYSERQRHMIPTIMTKYNSLTTREINIYQQTWCLTDMIEVTNKKLNIKPFRREPP
jgi:hypothetical protein